MSKRNRKRKLAAEEKALFEWEKDRILPENVRLEMETMWEIPQIYHFLQLTKEALNICHLSMYEVERMLLMPKASKQLAHIMTCLLSSSSTTKSKLHRVPPMPYEFWTNILMHKLKSWFKIYQTKRQDSVKVFDTYGIEPEFWIIFSDIAETEGKDFLNFTFKQRVWLLKTLCDTAMHSRKTIQDEMAKQPFESQFETILGIDRFGARYIYFPQFLHNDLRIYKHCLENKIISSVKTSYNDMKVKKESMIKDGLKPVSRIASRKKRRRSRWSNGSLPQKKQNKKKNDISSTNKSMIDSNSNSIDTTFSNRSCTSSKASEINNLVKLKSDFPTVSKKMIDATIVTKCEKDSIQIQTKDVREAVTNLKTEIEETIHKKTEEVVVENDLSKSLKTFVKNEDAIIKENNLSTIDDLSKSSKTDDEKLEEISSMNASKNSERSGDPDLQLFSSFIKEINISKSDDEKLSESKKYDISSDAELLSDNFSLNKWINSRKQNINESPTNSENDEIDDSIHNNSITRRSTRIKKSENKLEAEMENSKNIFDIYEIEELSSINVRDNLCRVSPSEIDNNCLNGNFNESEWKVDDFNKLIRDLSISNFQLVASSLDSLNGLIQLISSDKRVPGFTTTKENFIRPLCEEKLLKRMKVLSVSLEKVETILKESTKKARNKLQREWNNFENSVADEEEDAEDGSNRWFIGSQGWLLQGVGSDRPPPLPYFALSPVGCREFGTEEVPGFASADTSESPDSELCTVQKVQLEPESHTTCNARGSDKSINQVNKVNSRKDRQRKAKAEGCEEEKDINAEEKNEPEKITRVLRARGVSSYTEQLFSDDESEEDKLDRWTDIEAIYATPSAQISTSTPNTPTKSRDSCNDSEKEDSDQDWILPSSRKRKNKRPSASRRLKSFQYKLQNMKIDQDSIVNDDRHQHPSIVKDTKVLPYYTIQEISENVNLSTISPTKSPTKSLHKSDSSKVRNNTVAKLAVKSISASSLVPSNPVKIESQDTRLHSVLDIKDEGPVYDTISTSQNISCVQPNYVVVTTDHAPVTNYYVMQQNPPTTAVVQQSQFIQPTTFVSQMSGRRRVEGKGRRTSGPPALVPGKFGDGCPCRYYIFRPDNNDKYYYPQVQALQQVQTVSPPEYYVQQNTGQNYIVQNPSGLITASPRQSFIASGTPQVVYQTQHHQQVITASPGYVQYVTSPQQHQQQQQQQQQQEQQQQQQQQQQTSPVQASIINTTTLTPPRQITYRMRGPVGLQNNARMPLAARQQNYPHPNGAVIRSTPLIPNVLRPGQRVRQQKYNAPIYEISPTVLDPNEKSAQLNSTGCKLLKTTSLIVLSDSDDEIEMIITEKNDERVKIISSPEKSDVPSQKVKNILPPELMQLMSDGGISISPIKPVQTTVSQSTQLVVVVNETGSHYALALPNGSKLILTPEQVAQIRASNGGKLVL